MTARVRVRALGAGALVALALAATLAISNAATATATAGAATTTSHPRPRASLTQIENEVMCVACHESLAVAQSPEAFSERDYIRTEIAQGKTRKQIENDLVQQYGPAVLGLPPAHGFNLLVYVVPPVVVLGGIALLVFTIPRWQRRGRTARPPATAAVALSAADASRLQQDIDRRD